jgi:glucokinase
MIRIVAGDIGGTKTLLQVVEMSGSGNAVAHEQRFDSGSYQTFDDLLAEFLAQAPGTVDAACFAVAGPVFEDRAEVTNLKWRMEGAALAARFGIGRVALINDFYAVALGVPLLKPEGLVSLHAGDRKRPAPIAILGAGTGLGQALVTFNGAAWDVIPSEGGHADFAPQDEEQTRLFLFLREKYGHVSWERLLSGMGLVNIFTFLGSGDRTAAEIAQLAEDGDPRAVRTFEIFVDIYGAEAGNMALRALTRGGVFLAGGVAAKNQRFFTDGRFVAAFLRKGRFQEMLGAMPIDLIVNEKVGVIGAAEMARRVGAEKGEG